MAKHRHKKKHKAKKTYVKAHHRKRKVRRSKGALGLGIKIPLIGIKL